MGVHHFHAYEQVATTLYSYHLYFLHFTLSPFATASLCASSSANAGSCPPPHWGAGITHMKKTSHRTAYNSPAAAESLQRPPRFHRYICNCTWLHLQQTPPSSPTPAILCYRRCQLWLPIEDYLVSPLLISANCSIPPPFLCAITPHNP